MSVGSRRERILTCVSACAGAQTGQAWQGIRPAADELPFGKSPASRSKARLRLDSRLAKLLITAVEQGIDDGGWANMRRVSSCVTNNSSFSPINYGYRKSSELIKATGLFRVELRNGTAMYIRDPKG